MSPRPVEPEIEPADPEEAETSDVSPDAVIEAEAIEIEALAREQADDDADTIVVSAVSVDAEDGDTDTSDSSDPSDGPTPSLPIPADPKAPGVSQASALTAYMSQLRHHAPISREEEHALAVKWVEDGDVDAAKQLVLANLRLVVKISMEYRRAWTNTLDLIQEGNVGLMEAVQRFDPYQGVKLSSYAVYWIRAYILKYILDNMRSVRLGTTRASRKLFFRLNKEKRELERQGYEVEPRLLAERLDVSEDDVIDMEARLSRPDVSFDAPVRSDESDGMTFGDRMAAPGVSSEATVGANELRRVFLDTIAEFAEGLEDRDRQILDERILAEEPRTLADLGEEFAVSRERVRQLEAKLVKRLRAYMEENLVDFEYYAPGGGS
ncbi:MAG: RNA polymerase factor sigma-32 [bacterium]|nr:RNA polymerase factor sigma-32 [bacterium]